MVSSWRTVWLWILGAFLFGNVIFACLFLLLGNAIENARPGSFFDAFFFSVQTMATIGYGQMRPVGFAANMLTAFEAFFGLLIFAFAAGLVFAKFSRPTAKIAFSNIAIVGRRNGQTCLMFRMINERDNQIVDASLMVMMIRSEVTLEGDRIRTFHEMPLLRNRTPIFTMTWTAVHPLDEKSPLFGVSRAELDRQNIEVVVTFTGIDESFAANVHARHSYTLDEILWDHRFKDILSIGDGGERIIDYTLFHEAEPLP